ncbi:MAG: FHA domain-containing protein [candidate division KSB1 bacterium]|nr:FHA domain-containing protein [candidate division KSB1 bacterium]MDZ7342495.1 FHA domain-containing protein [candidate division KSB1 bacterium]
MYQIKCHYCGQIFQFENSAQKPDTCSNCNTFIGDIKPENLAAAQPANEANPQKGLLGLNLTYEKTGQTIELRQFQKVILGRENLGRDVLGQVPQISRKHCSIERIGDQFVVSDEGSKNGTFIQNGINRIDCKLHPGQVLHDNDYLFLGQEPLLVKFVYAPSQQPSQVETMPSNDQSQSRRYSCFNCGAIFDQPQESCPECNSFGSVKAA